MSNRMADFRKIRRMSLDDLSEACGLSKSTLSELERGMTQPMLDSARRIANALDAYEHEIWPEDATMPLTARTVDDDLSAAKARIAELEKITEEATSILCGQNFKGNSPLELMARKAMRRMKELEKALERIRHRCEAYIEADAPMQPDSSVAAIDRICAAALLNKEPTND